jgi:DNA-binding transcriptional ArsR family regulator
VHIQELATKVSQKCEVFSNPIRSLIVSLVVVKNGITWTELRQNLEELVGEINPNTLSFHIGKLVDAGLLVKAGTRLQPKYKIPEERVEEAKRTIGQALIKEVERKYKK